MRLLLIEDDREISEMLRSFLESEQYEVDAAYDGINGYDIFMKENYDLVLLDLMIPRMSGMEVMKRIREASMVPIIIISAKDSDSDKTLGLGLGADDYITKPFSVTEVLARIKANIRRNTIYINKMQDTCEDNLLCAKNLTMDLNNYTVRKDEKEIELTVTEYEILKLLWQNPKKVYTKQQIYYQIWKDEYMGDENAVNVQISRLRSKIEDNPKKPEYVMTVWGIGYKFGIQEKGQS